ncbi:HAD family hydrolase [Rhodohalobacter sp. SW132]|uniref:HAD family hydrolase n=1 Tax=Rhodohalobacter sp. SW132 TaxID=2293433 RepID=UPI000E240CE4|nr:HAD family hydrolase [Rhodohalobacter sp. SW132]REL29091.1 HAD family hydrolase [Rhodohalobacter sp. SW132]
MKQKTLLAERFKELSNPLQPEPTGEQPQLTKLTGIKAVIFDFYGTLFISGVGDIGIDDGNSDSQLLLDALDGADIEVSDPKAGKRGYEIYNKVVTDEIQEIKASGIPYPEPDIRKVWRNVLNQMYAEGLIRSSTSSDDHERMAVEFEVRMNPVWPMEDLHETLEILRNKEMILGIISNSQFYTPIAFEALAGHNLTSLGFDQDLLHWSFEESRKKPGLQFYENFMEKASKKYPALQPENYLYVGNDMLKDVYPAHEMGMKTALFAGDNRSLKWRKDDSRTKNLKPDIVITTLSQIAECI